MAVPERYSEEDQLDESSADFLFQAANESDINAAWQGLARYIDANGNQPQAVAEAFEARFHGRGDARRLANKGVLRLIDGEWKII